MVSSELKDPSLADGLAYLVESGPYRGWLLTMTDQKEVSDAAWALFPRQRRWLILFWFSDEYV
jgi:hypothetical protein